MPYTTAGKNAMLAALGVTHAAVFQGDPSAGGTELDRKAITFNAISGGSMDQASSAIVFDIQGGETVNHVGYYNASSGGTLLAYDPVTAEVFASAGTYSLTESTLHLNA